MKSNDQQVKRELRLKIGRMRRRIDSRIRATAVEGHELVNWRTYVTRYPAAAVLAAFGLGMSGATLFRPQKMLRSLGSSILRGSADRAVNLAWQEWKRYRQSAGEES
jgi:hypothetical protein